MLEKNNPLATRQMLAWIYSDPLPDNALSSAQLLALEGYLSPGYLNWSERSARILFQLITKLIPTWLRLLVLKPIRKIRKKKARPIVSPLDCQVNQIVIALDRLPISRRGYAGKRSALCLTYDVDLKACQAYLPSLLKQLDRYGLRATFNVLTHWEYQIDWALLAEARAQGHEIGLHGSTHDIALGYRNPKKIRKSLKKALDAFPFKPLGYRAPALCMTPALMSVIAELGFEYDSSLPMSNMFYKSTETCFPYPVPNLPTVVEIPITLMDTNLFADLRLTQEQALLAALTSIDQIYQLGGVNCLTLHPSIAASNPDFSSNLFKNLSERSDIQIVTMHEILDILKSSR